MENNISCICLLFVLYNPLLEDLNFIKKISKNYKCIVIDNSTKINIEQNDNSKIIYISLGKNMGIAYAQNIGFKYILNKNDLKYVILFDQDSRFEEIYPYKIIEQFESNRFRHPNLAIIGPTIEHIDKSGAYKSVIHRYKVDDTGFIKQRDLISSGCCIPTNNLKYIGLNDEKLFIDFVDYDWCWRAEAKGYICGRTTKASIYHQVGQKEIRFPFGYKVIVSSPFRYFYQFRNYLWLCRRKYVPLQWKIATGIKHLTRLFYFPLFVKKGSCCWKYMIKGIIAGLNTEDKTI